MINSSGARLQYGGRDGPSELRAAVGPARRSGGDLRVRLRAAAPAGAAAGRGPARRGRGARPEQAVWRLQGEEGYPEAFFTAAQVRSWRPLSASSIRSAQKESGVCRTV